MVDAKTFVVSVAVVLSVFRQPGINTQPTIGSSSEDYFCSQPEDELEWVKENKRLLGVLENEQQRTKTLESLSSVQSDKIRQLRLENERDQMRSRESHRDAVKFIGRYGRPAQIPAGITKVEDSIYVLRMSGIDVYEDQHNFSFIKRIDLSETTNPCDIVYSNKSKSVYISGYRFENIIWVMTTTGEHRQTRWLTGVTWPYTLSLSNDGNLMVLRQGETFHQLEIYSLNASLIRILQLPLDIKVPRHAAQTPAGNFIIPHRLNNATYGPWVISELNDDGHLIHRFIPRNQSEQLNHPEYLLMDSVSNRLFVADRYNNRVILFDPNCLTWSRVLVSGGIGGIGSPYRMVYDTRKKLLLVIGVDIPFTVYEIK